MVGKLLYEVIPFFSQKEKMKLIKEFKGRKIITLDNCIMIKAGN